MESQVQVVEAHRPSVLETEYCAPPTAVVISRNAAGGWRLLRRLSANITLRLGSLLLITLISIALIRYGPGFETDERLLDPTLGTTARDAIRAERAQELNFFSYCKTFLAGALRGDFGTSHSLGLPVQQLVVERGAISLHILIFGTVFAWTGAFGWAFATVLIRGKLFSGTSSGINALLLCVPTAALTAVLFGFGRSPETILGLALMPKIFQVARGLLQEASQHPVILAAHARGLSRFHIAGWHILPYIAGPMLAWLMVSLSLAIGAIVPIEVICDVPGLGQLAWKASLARDLPVLVTLTLLVASIIQMATAVSSLASGVVRGEAA